MIKNNKRRSKAITSRCIPRKPATTAPVDAIKIVEVLIEVEEDIFGGADSMV